jgi:SOS-response transcriptional repressor LexA
MRHQTTQAVYRFLYSYYEEHGFGPTQHEIASGCYLARSTVLWHLDRLTVWGWISRETNKARSICPLKPLEALDGEGEGEKIDKNVQQNSQHM